MGAHAVVEEYFSGQGVVLIGQRDAQGQPAGLRPVGNVPALSIKNATSVLEHKESTTGARGTDKRITTEIKVTLDMTMENFNSTNLANAIRGAVTEYESASVTDDDIFAYPGLITPLKKMGLSSVKVQLTGGTDLVIYSDDQTEWDYKLNAEAGSVQFNDGSVLGFDKLGAAASAISVGATTEISIINDATVGGWFYFGQGWTGADAALVNGKKAKIITGTDATKIVVDMDLSAKTITKGSSVSAWDGQALHADYTYIAQKEVGAFTEGVQEMYLRFEGLNTAESNSPVVIEVFRFMVDPTQDLSMISDGLQQFVLSGSVLMDPKQPTGSKYYKVMKTDVV